MSHLHRFLVAACLMFAASQASAQTVPAPGLRDEERDTMPTLWAGDAAPPIAIGKWVKGGPVTGFERGRIYVVEFWATWCVPCVKSMPHLAEVQAKYREKGLTVISAVSYTHLRA